MPTGLFWGRVAVLVVSAFLGLTAVLAVFKILPNLRHASATKPGDENAKADPAVPSPAASAAKLRCPVAQFNRRWLPEQTVLVADIHMSRLTEKTRHVQSVDLHVPPTEQPPVLNALAFLGDWWPSADQELLSDLGLEPKQVHRMTWAATNPADCLASSVVAIELEEHVDATHLLPTAESGINLGENRVACRLSRGRWPHPFLVVDAHTVVTGNEETLRQLVARDGDAKVASGSIELLLKNLSPGGDLAVMVDLSRSGSAKWKLPANFLNVWPAGKLKWHLLCEKPMAWGLAVQSAEKQPATWGWSAATRRRWSARNSKSWGTTQSRPCRHISPR